MMMASNVKMCFATSLKEKVTLGYNVDGCFVLNFSDFTDQIIHQQIKQYNISKAAVSF